MPAGTIRLRFVRPPDNVKVWVHELLREDEGVIVQRFSFSELPEPFTVAGRAVVDNGHVGVLYELVGRSLEVIKVYGPGSEFKGYYCNINTSPRPFEGGYEVTDLFLDVWVFPDLEYVVLDQDEFDEAVRRGWLDTEQADLARSVLGELVEDLDAGRFPPQGVPASPEEF